MPCSRTQNGLTRVGLEPPTSGISSLDTRCCDSMRSGTDVICQFMVTRSVTIESPVQIRSHTSKYGISRSSTGLS